MALDKGFDIHAAALHLAGETVIETCDAGCIGKTAVAGTDEFAQCHGGFFIALTHLLHLFPPFLQLLTLRIKGSLRCGKGSQVRTFLLVDIFGLGRFLPLDSLTGFFIFLIAAAFRFSILCGVLRGQCRPLFFGQPFGCADFLIFTERYFLIQFLLGQLAVTVLDDGFGFLPGFLGC